MTWPVSASHHKGGLACLSFSRAPHYPAFSPRCRQTAQPFQWHRSARIAHCQRRVGVNRLRRRCACAKHVLPEAVQEKNLALATRVACLLELSFRAQLRLVPASAYTPASLTITVAVSPILGIPLDAGSMHLEGTVATHGEPELRCKGLCPPSPERNFLQDSLPVLNESLERLFPVQRISERDSRTGSRAGGQFSDDRAAPHGVCERGDRANDPRRVHFLGKCYNCSFGSRQINADLLVRQFGQ